MLLMTTSSLTHLADLTMSMPLLPACSMEYPSSGEEGGKHPNALFSQGQRSQEDPGVQREKNRWEQREKEKVREGQHQENGKKGHIGGVSVEHPCGWGCGMGGMLQDGLLTSAASFSNFSMVLLSMPPHL